MGIAPIQKKIDFLGPKEVVLSNIAIDRLVNQRRMNRAAARQFLKRCADSGVIWRSEAFKLTNGGCLGSA